jgi:hypothetical protein
VASFADAIIFSLIPNCSVIYDKVAIPLKLHPSTRTFPVMLDYRSHFLF